MSLNTRIQLKQTSGLSVFQNMTMKCFILSSVDKERKKNFTKKQFNTSLNLFIPSVTRDCRRLTMEQQKRKRKGSVMSGGEVVGVREWVLHQHVHRIGSVSNSTSFFYVNWTWRVWWSDDQRVKEPKGKKSVGRPTSCCGQTQTDRDFMKLPGHRSENVSAFYSAWSWSV